MNHWTTPKSYRKYKEESYISLDHQDSYYQNYVNVTKAPRKEYLKKPTYSNFLEKSNNQDFSCMTMGCNHLEAVDARYIEFSPRSNHFEQREEVECLENRDIKRMQSDIIDYGNESAHLSKSIPHLSGITSPPRIFRHVTPQHNIFQCNDEEDKRKQNYFPIQTRHDSYRAYSIKSPKQPLNLQFHEVVGHPSLNIHRLKLPSHYLYLLDEIVEGCEDHARNLPCGWHTDLYSLTKQDIALREAPEVYNLARPIVSYLKRVASLIYSVQGLKCDRNQPHVLKYAGSHKSVELHHDKCDVTINIMLSRSNTYTGGGTYFPDAGTNVRLEFGEFLLHPGGIVHAGSPISSGSRYLMVLFCNEK